MAVKEMTGEVFGRLAVVGRSGSDKSGNAKWRCVCECGEVKDVLGQSLRNGSTVSCGCFNREIVSSHKTHGASHTSEYKAWYGMLQRCTNPNHEKWHRYGGRGISVCDRWKDYQNFLNDMGTRPPGMTIDRENNDGNYEPSNCRWATQKTQGNNRGNNRTFTIDGIERTLSDASRKFGISKETVRGRLSCGWEADAAFKTPIQIQRKQDVICK